MDELLFSSGELCLERAGNGAWPWAWTRPGLAAQQDPDNAGIQKGYLELLAELERYNETALEESSRVVERFPQNWEIAALRLRLLVGAEQWEAALETVNRLTELLQGVGTLGPRKSEPLLEDHTAILRALDREQEIEGARAFWLSKRFAPRPVLAGTNQIDLTTFYNAALDDDWHNQADRGNNLASLELDRTAEGLLRLGGVTFDARGIVQLSSTEVRRFCTGYPQRVGNIPVKAPVQRMHFDAEPGHHGFQGHPTLRNPSRSAQHEAGTSG